MKIKPYDRNEAIRYAEKWAYKRNAKYYNFDLIGGDCTSFVSQCLYAGCNIMNYKKYIGWYYNTINDRTASWSGVEFLCDFLTKNQGVGPRAILTQDIKKINIGDIVQLKFYSNDRFSHSLIIVDKKEDRLEEIYVATHTDDMYYRKITTYSFEKIRFLNIKEIGI